MRIEGVVFDVGNVLFAYDPGYIVDQLLPGSPYKQLYLEHLFNAPIWQAMDRGDISTFEAVASLTEQLGVSHSDAVLKCITYFVDHLHKIEPSYQAFCLAQTKLPVYILSNFQDQPFERLTKRHPFLRTVAGQIVSARVGFNKPEIEIYSQLFTTYKLDPKTLFFIDDREENILAGKKLGMGTHHFKDPQTLLNEMELLLTHV